MPTIALSGSRSGIGAALRARLERANDRVIGIDLRDAEVLADLADPRERERAVARVLTLAGGRLDGVVGCAGVGPQVESRPTIVALDYFGARALLDGLRPALAQGAAPAAVAVASNAATLGSAHDALTAACLADDEAEAQRLAAELDGFACYASAKRALARWIRLRAPGPGWAGSGIRLNAVAPGAVRTPLLEAGLAHPVYGPAIRDFPIPTGGFGTPDDVAAVIEFLLGPGARFMCGSIVFCDGGSDAAFRADTF